MSGLHFHPLKIRSVRPDTDEAVIVSFDVPSDLADAFRFTQGQHLTLRNTISGSDERRSYSICAGIDDGELRVGVRKVPGGRFSTWINESLKPGDTIQVMAPEGRFFVPLDPAASRHYLGIAGGSGITPILSIMKTVLAAEPKARFTLIYGNRKLRSTMFTEELEDLKNRYLSRLTLHLVFSQEATDLPLYHEDRSCTAPTAARVFDHLTPIQRHHLTRDRHTVQTFEPQLTPLQTQLLDLLAVPTSAYTSQP